MISEDTRTLLTLGLFLMVVAVLAAYWQRRLSQPRPPDGLPPWRASAIDFCLWLWILWCVLFLSHLAQSPLTSGLPEDSLFVVVASGLVAQIAFLATQLFLLKRVPALSSRPLDTSVLSHPQAALGGFLDFLIALPFIVAASFCWEKMLDLLKYFDPSLTTPAQEPVLLFLQGGSPGLLALLAFMAIVLAPANEELIFRGGLYRFLKSRCRPSVALLCSSLLFGLAHFNLRQFLPLVLIGVFLVRTYERTGRIIAPMVFHASFNAVNIVLLLLSPTTDG